MATTSTTGSTLLQPLSNAVQLPIDQLLLCVCSGIPHSVPSYSSLYL
ncbi:MBOAT2 isoform 2 [Pan troglodytes]|uniref:Membrane bound O-acyltransferase domain containing 2 n=3 Tax=Hominidae TaxID=9604 RepID=F8WDJ6_HUMAN|nr:MBOAT2 isoform 2 [Pan troglodytes]PNJ52202.1 MBOAT2 isoform 7 [Pongo abelii]